MFSDASMLSCTYSQCLIPRQCSYKLVNLQCRFLFERLRLYILVVILLVIM